MILTQAMIRMDLEDIMLSEISQIRKGKSCIIHVIEVLRIKIMGTESRMWLPGAGEKELLFNGSEFQVYQIKRALEMMVLMAAQP